MTERTPDERPADRPSGAEPTPAQPDPWSADPATGRHQPGERVLYGSAFAAGPTGPAGQMPVGSGGLPHAGHAPPGQHHPYGAPMPAIGGQPNQRTGRGGLLAGLTALALVVGGGAGAVGGYLVADSQTGGGSSVTVLDAPKPASRTEAAPAGSIEAVAEKLLPSVVQLQVRGSSAAGEGSGFVISPDGLIVTNNHVVEAAADGGQIAAVFSDGTTARASIVGRDPTSDLAVVRAEGVSGRSVVELGRSDDLRVGQSVVAIGSPFELSGTVTSGIISALHRPTTARGEDSDLTTVMDAIQTDAAINPGNSGGPLVNMQGQVIGINSAIYSPRSSGGTGGSVGIGFAIPIDQARRTADEIVKTGKATQTVLGVSVRNEPDGGARIDEVTAGGSGEQAGLKPGDVIVRLDNRKIDTSAALVAAVRSKAPGDKVTLTLADGSRTVQVTLGGQQVEVG